MVDDWNLITECTCDHGNFSSSGQLLHIKGEDMDGRVQSR